MRFTFGKFTFGTFTRDQTDITPAVESGVSDILVIARQAINNLALRYDPITNLVLAQNAITNFDIVRVQLNANLDIGREAITELDINKD
jgi:hypothetical protein